MRLTMGWRLAAQQPASADAFQRPLRSHFQARLISDVAATENAQ